MYVAALRVLKRLADTFWTDVDRLNGKAVTSCLTTCMTYLVTILVVTVRRGTTHSIFLPRAPRAVSSCANDTLSSCVSHLSKPRPVSSPLWVPESGNLS